MFFFGQFRPFLSTTLSTFLFWTGHGLAWRPHFLRQGFVLFSENQHWWRKSQLWSKSSMDWFTRKSSGTPGFPPKYRAKTCGFPAKAPPHASPLRRGSRGDPLLPPCAPSLRLEGAAGPWRYSKQCRDNLGKLKPTEICAGCIVLPCVDSWKEWVIFDGMDGYAPADLHIRAHVCKYIYMCVCVNCFFYWNLVPQTS